MKLRTLCTLSLALLPLAGCAEGEGPVGPERGARGPADQPVDVYLACNVSVSSGDLSCSAPELELPGSVSGAILGGQARYVLLESSGASYDDAQSLFSASVAVRNFLSQPLGTTDGETADADGVRIFFVSEPQVTGGSGVVTVNNADGVAEFTAADQPYFRYNGPIKPGIRSGVKVWRWDVPSTVESFSFLVGVSAKVPNENDVVSGVQLEASTVTAGEYHTCALDLEGKAYCWGSNDAGQLGDGTTTSRPTPTPVAGDLRFISISAGFEHTCGVAADSTAYCWGDAWYGRLGNGASGQGNIFPTPQPVSTDKKFVKISATSTNGCALTPDGDIYCWGHGQAGRIGDGSLTNRFTPVKVIGDLKFKDLIAAHQHICGLTLEGSAYCWGTTALGRLGNGQTSGIISQPVPVQGGITFATMSASSSSSCGLTPDGDAYCWGSNQYGKLGTGNVNDTVASPVPVIGGHKFVQVTVGEYHACALKADGQAWCWGRGTNGRRGDGVTSESNAAQPVQVGGTQKFKYIHTSKSHTCGINLEDRIYCWGLNDTQQRQGVGNSNTAIPYPRLISPIAP